MEDHYKEVFKDIKKVLVTVAHPDDMEILFGGTIARLREDGVDVRVIVCTNGALGSRENDIGLDDLKKLRETEQENAARSLGLNPNDVFILPFDDCTLTEHDPQLIERIVFHMRQFRPDVVFTHYFESVIEKTFSDFIWVNHRDHRAVGIATIDSVLPMSRDISFFPEHKKQGLSGISINKILVPDQVNGKLFIDINSTVETKRNSMRSHISQLDENAVEDIIAGFDINDGVEGKEVSYFEKFRFFELGYNQHRKVYEED